MLSALVYLHETKGLMHRDLKPENILMESTDKNDIQIKISDFGFATKIVAGESLPCGSPMYMSPQLHEQIYYDEKVDIWALGVITYILLSGRPPFPGRTGHEVHGG
jgi:calcium-dependent protein kinase